MAYFNPTDDKWVIYYQEGGSQPANAIDLLAYFSDWSSWLNFLSATHSGGYAEMTMHAQDRVSHCRVLHKSQAGDWSTYDNPSGLSANRP